MIRALLPKPTFIYSQNRKAKKVRTLKDSLEKKAQKTAWLLKDSFIDKGHSH